MNYAELIYLEKIFVFYLDLPHLLRNPFRSHPTTYFPFTTLTCSKLKKFSYWKTVSRKLLFSFRKIRNSLRSFFSKPSVCQLHPRMLTAIRIIFRIHYSEYTFYSEIKTRYNIDSSCPPVITDPRFVPILSNGTLMGGGGGGG